MLPISPEQKQELAQLREQFKAFPFHVDAHPAFAKEFQHPSGVKRWQISPMAANRSVKVLAPTLRR
jgi:hypothetical protein